jgi:L-threonylcarbamoyladenylate synthase
MAVAPKQLVHQLAQTVARLIPASVSGLQDAGSELRQGNLVAFPTGNSKSCPKIKYHALKLILLAMSCGAETVYGLGANAYNEEAVRNIFLTKGRPLTG